MVTTSNPPTQPDICMLLRQGHVYIHTVWSPCVSEERVALGTELDKLEEEWLDVKAASARMPGS